MRVRLEQHLLSGIAALACIAALAGCTSTPTSPTPVVTYSQADLRIGTGTEAASGNTITVNYTG
ncbi:MAG: peptidylprolyl isomerase, partial [Acidobacteria bacterium]